MRAVRPLVLVLLLSLALPAVASAVVVAPGSNRGSLAQAPDGTALAAYAVGQSLGFCRLPFRAKACVTTAIPSPVVADAAGADGSGTEIRDVRLLRRADGVLVVLTRVFDLDGAATDSNQVFASLSGDVGATWSPPVLVGLGQEQLGSVTLSADGLAVLSLAGDFKGEATISRFPLAGPAAGPIRDLRPVPDDIASQWALITTPDGGTVAGFRTQERFGLSRLAPGGDLATGWTPWVRAGRIKAFELGQSWATGPRGTYLLARRALLRQVRSNYRSLYVRKLTATGVSKGRLLGSNGTNYQPALAQDSLGGLHVAYAAGAPNAILYMRTRGARGKCSFGRQTRQARIPSRDFDDGLQLAAATPKRAALAFPSAAGFQVRFARGGDRPRPRRSPAC